MGLSGISYNSLKIGFREYLEEQALKNGKDIDDIDSNVSIFLHKDEFKAYLTDVLGVEQASLSLDISAIMKGLSDGSIMIENPEEVPEESEEVNLEEGEGEIEEEVPQEGEIQEGELPEEGTEESIMLQMITEAINDEAVRKQLDMDNDGEVSEKELSEFLLNINNLDNDSSALTFEELAMAMQSIYDGTFNDLIQEEIDRETEEFNQIAQNQPLPVSDITPVAPQRSYGNPGAYMIDSQASGSRSSTTGTQGSVNYENMSLPQLQVEKANQQQKVDDYRQEVASINDGSKYTDEQQNIDELKEEYFALLDKDGNEELLSVEQSIVDTEQEIATCQSNISDKDNEISQQQNTISGLETTLSSLKSQEGQLQSVSSDNEEAYKDAQTKLSSIRAEIEKIETQKQEAEEQLTSLQDEKTELETNLTELQEKLTSLQEQKAELEQNLSEETTLAKEAYDTAKSNLLDVKASDLQSVNTNLEAAKTTLQEIDQVINEKTASQVTDPYRQGPVYDTERAQALADAAISLYGNDNVANGYCATGVSNSIQKAFGYRTSGNGCDYGNVLSNLDDWVEVTDFYSVEDLKNLPAGAVVSWSTYEAGHTRSNGRYGHVFISDGQGHELSDYCGNISTKYYDWGATYRVFLPK